MKIFRLTSGMRMFYFILTIGLLWSFTSYSQEKTIKVLDKKTGQPVADIYFKYDAKTGFSDSDGKIELSFTKGQSLFLSHIQYGKIVYGPSKVEEAVLNGTVHISASDNYLLPVTYIHVRPGVGEKSSIDVSVQNKLAHDAGNLLESVPAISTIRKSGAYGFDPVLRGFKYDQLNLVIDGVQTASAACPNRMDPASSQVPINMISQAEVLKGPHSMRYGNAFGGTINFKSSSPQFREKITPRGRFGTSYESNGNIFRTEGVAGVSGTKADLSLFGAYSQGGNYIDGDGISIDAGFNRLNWGGKLGVKLSDTQNLGLLVSNNFAKDVDFPALPMDLREDNTWLVNASHSAQFYGKALSSWNTTVYGTKVKHLMDNFDKILNPRKVDAETDAETNNYGGRTELRFDFTKSYLFGGLDYRFESADGYRTREMLMGPMAGKTLVDNVWQDAQVNRTGVFGEYHFDKKTVHLVFSARLDFNSARANNPDPRFSAIYNEMESNHIHPSFSVGGTKMFGQSTSVGIWLGRASRSPGITERFINQFPVGLDPYEMLGNPQLEPEVNNQVDLNFQYQTEKTNLNINLFSSFLRNYISSEIREDLKPAMPTAPGVRQFINIDKALMTGFEANWNQILTKNLGQDLSIVYTYGQNQVLAEPLPEIPPLEFRYRLKGTFVKDNILPEIMLRQTFKQDRIANSYGETETPGFNVVDVKVSWLVNNIITATGGVQNIFDTAYYEHLSRSVRNAEAHPIYSPGRSFYVTLTVSFI